MNVSELPFNKRIENVPSTRTSVISLGVTVIVFLPTVLSVIDHGNFIGERLIVRTEAEYPTMTHTIVTVIGKLVENI